MFDGPPLTVAVSLAWSAKRWMPVTIKLPRPGAINRRSCAALERESHLVGSLNHPAVQRLLDARCEASVPYLVFEYVEGRTLAQLLDETGRLAPGDVVRLGMQIASALHYIHGQGVVHCDVKPTNLVLRAGRVVLIDFDVARTIDDGAHETKAVGSAEYMAPEQARGSLASPAMDLFALGAVLYEAATDRVAFAGDGEAAARYRQLTNRPVPPRTVDPTIPLWPDWTNRLLSGSCSTGRSSWRPERTD